VQEPGSTRHGAVVPLGITAGVGVVLTIVVIIARAALTNSIDLPVDRDLVAARTRWLTGLFKAVTWLGDPTVVSVALVFFGVLVALRDRRLGVAIVLLALARGLVSWSLKTAIARPRPDLAPLAHPNGASYPSGHALGATVLWGSIAIVVGRYVRSDVLRRAIQALCAVVVLAVMTSRVYLGVHWLSDVVAGACFGVALLALLALCVPARAAPRQREPARSPS
jgi:membrane-associated phospholipid phosphatase